MTVSFARATLRRFSLSAVLIAGAAASPLACSLIAPLDDSAYGGDPDGATPDAADAAAVGDAADGHCDSAFCDNFERDANDVQGMWKQLSSTPSDALSLVLDTDTARGQVLRVRGCLTAKSCLLRNDFPDASLVTYGFYLKIIAGPPIGTNVNLSGIQLLPGNGTLPQSFLLLEGTDAGGDSGAPSALAQQTGNDGTTTGETQSPVLPVLPVNSWVHVEMTFDLGAGRATLAVEGQQMPTTTNLPASFVSPAPFTAFAGQLYSNDASATVEIDDVTVDWK